MNYGRGGSCRVEIMERIEGVTAVTFLHLLYFLMLCLCVVPLSVYHCMYYSQAVVLEQQVERWYTLRSAAQKQSPTTGL